MQAELLVHISFVLWIGAVEQFPKVAELRSHGSDLLFVESFRNLGDRLVQAHLLDLSLGFCLGDPAGDHHRIGPGIKNCAIAHQLALTLGDGLTGSLNRCQPMVIRQLRIGHGPDRRGELFGVEGRGQPSIERLDDQLLAHVDR
ncbi:hypothetical protein [Nonomuraea sp. NEAU-A123]|uniref:hypothetical protein n=1 Tax=Nonomuraea sp. NEAU-A123 TaxID=2839649 RepID=UPI001BE405D6|nr:hypothetical protein [Nonomuraea sp. NEAU-A123]MBT2233201.1 hypothetical protein [Nonomuraea sp. NEAU-A123]